MSTTSNNQEIKEKLEKILKTFIENVVTDKYLYLHETIDKFKFDKNIDNIIFEFAYLRDALNELTNLDDFNEKNMQSFLSNIQKFCENNLSSVYLNSKIFKIRKYREIKDIYLFYERTFCSEKFNGIIEILKSWHKLKQKLSKYQTLIRTHSSIQASLPTYVGRQESPRTTTRTISSLQTSVVPRELGRPQSIQTSRSVVPLKTEIERPKTGIRSLFFRNKVDPSDIEIKDIYKEPKISTVKRFWNYISGRNKIAPDFTGVGGLVKKIPKKKNVQKKKNQSSTVVGGLVKKIPQKKHAKKNRNQG